MGAEHMVFHCSDADATTLGEAQEKIEITVGGYKLGAITAIKGSSSVHAANLRSALAQVVDLAPSA